MIPGKASVDTFKNTQARCISGIPVTGSNIDNVRIVFINDYGGYTKCGQGIGMGYLCLPAVRGLPHSPGRGSYIDLIRIRRMKSDYV